MTEPTPTEPTPADLTPADLPIEELRRYRARLREEEDRVSYWRRLVHARIDLVQAGRGVAGGLSQGQVERALGDTAGGRRREALHRVRAFDPLPELPVLAEVWDAGGDDRDGGALVARLAQAAEQLSTYRTALHARIDESTAELIARYRNDPTAALAVLPS